MHLSKQIECMIHHLKLVFPENDHEMVPLINSVDALIEHHLEFILQDLWRFIMHKNMILQLTKKF